jgi:hypothetical protein
LNSEKTYKFLMQWEIAILLKIKRKAIREKKEETSRN